MKIKYILPLVPLSLVTALLGCWYYSTSGSTLPPHIKTVAVPLAENETLEYGIEATLTDAVIAAFVSDNTLRVVEKKAADSLIKVKVIDVKDEPLTYSAEKTGEKAQEYRLSIQVQACYLDSKKDKKLWEEKLLEGWGAYEAPGETEQRAEGIDAAVKMLASEILQRTVAGW